MQAESSQRQIPAALKQWDHWMIWGKDEKGRKLLFAPWQRDDLYPVAWGADAETRPETDFETARRYWKHRQCYDMPDGIGANLGLMQPAPLLLHEPPMEPPLMLVDFDDVRDPETGAVTDEVADILDRLNAFVEISQSGAGLHAYVYANLPGDLGKFIEPLQDGGDIELYDHARAIGATWEHVDSTPDTVPDAQDVIDDLVATYESRATRRRRLNPSGFAPGSGPDHADFDTVGSDSGLVDSGGDRSPYFDINITKVANTGYFRRYGDETAGPHPQHGPISSAPENCTNFNIEPTHNGWYCFAHEAGGRAIELAAVLCPQTDLECKDLPRNAARHSWLRTQKPVELARAAIWLRANGVIGDDADPPLAVLAVLADRADLHTGRSDGLDAHTRVVKTIFKHLEPGDI